MTLLLDYWKPLVGFEGRYEVSITGRVRTLTKCSGRSKNYPFLRIAITSCGATSGYSQVHLYHNKRYYGPLLHRVVAAAFIGECPKGYEVNHKDGIKGNCRASNLEYVTSAANKQHALAMGLRGKGSEIKNAKLNEALVHHMKSARTTMSYADMARMYGVAQSTIKSAVYGKTWAHVGNTEVVECYNPYSDMTPADLSACGVKMYGKFWKQKLAATLGVSNEAVGKWFAGKHRISKTTAKRIIELAA